AAWAHIENVLAWGVLMGVDLNQKKDDESWKSVGEWLSVLDLTRATDFAFSTAPGDEEMDFAGVIPITDKSRFLEQAKKEYDVVEKKSRFYFEKKKSKEKDDADVADEAEKKKDK